MPDAAGYAERQFSNGLGRRAVLGNCADCGNALADITALVCKTCRNKWEDDERFLAREAGHRERISDLFRGVRDPSAKLGAPRKRKPKEVKSA